MYVSEHNFDHLRQAADERRSRELEYRRIALERSAETATTSERGLRVLVNRFRHSSYLAPSRVSHP